MPSLLSRADRLPTRKQPLQSSTTPTWTVVPSQVQPLHLNARKRKVIGSGLHGVSVVLKFIFFAPVPASSMIIRALGTWFTSLVSSVGFFSLNR